MSSFRQIEANRRNARLSTGPVTEEGKKKSRQNALRHGLTAETVIDALEDAEDYGRCLAETSGQLQNKVASHAPRRRMWPNAESKLMVIYGARTMEDLPFSQLCRNIRKPSSVANWPFRALSPATVNMSRTVCGLRTRVSLIHLRFEAARGGS